MTSAKTHSGEQVGENYAVYAVAKTRDFKVNAQGVHFGVTYHRNPRRGLVFNPEVPLEDHGNLVSRRDLVLLANRGNEETRLGVQGSKPTQASVYVDVAHLSHLQLDDLQRMDANAKRIMEAYGERV